MAYYGNLALRPERVQEQQPKPNRAPTPGKSKVTRRRTIPIGEKLLYLFVIFIVVLVAGFIIYRYAQIYQINGQIQTTTKIYDQAAEQTKELQREVERLSDPGRIKEMALEQGYVEVSGGITIHSKPVRDAVAIAP